MEKKGESELIRLQVYLAHAGVASRRAAEGMILAGRVTANGRTITKLGEKVSMEDCITLDGKLLTIEERKRYILLNKPAGLISSSSDPDGRALAIDLIRGKIPERVYNIGRLDQWSSGLLFFTNDGDLAAVMGHPSSQIEKEYLVITDLDIPDSFLVSFEKGITIEGVRYTAAKTERLSLRSAKITLIEGKNREIRRVLASADLRALSLQRIRIGPLLLGSIEEGCFRELSSSELEQLRQYIAARTSNIIAQPGNLEGSE